MIHSIKPTFLSVSARLPLLTPVRHSVPRPHTATTDLRLTSTSLRLLCLSAAPPRQILSAGRLGAINDGENDGFLDVVEGGTDDKSTDLQLKSEGIDEMCVLILTGIILYIISRDVFVAFLWWKFFNEVFKLVTILFLWVWVYKKAKKDEMQ